MFARSLNVFSLLALLLAACSGMERSEREKLKRRNCKAERIYRTKGSYLYSISPPLHTPRSLYPWESESNLPRITKEFFRCKGSLTHPPLTLTGEAGEPLAPFADCEGTRHGLPILRGQEGVYPILIELLNYLQKKTGKRVVITSGHRCPTHNAYVDLSPENRASKHQIGAEVDFYVQGMEDRPQEIAGLLMQYFHEQPSYLGQKEYLDFQRYEKGDGKVTLAPWFNKEIFIKLYQRGEGRNGDNRHPYPYLSVQVRYDKGKGERVIYDWQRAHRGYPRSP